MHRCGYASDRDSEQIALIRTDTMMREILNDTGADRYEVWLSDDRSNNFRYEIDPQYKANRKQPRPVHYEAIKEFLFDEWKANLALGQEADDSLGIRQVEEIEKHSGEQDCDGTTSICSIDKDLLQIPGQHYNFVRKEFSKVTKLDGIRYFYKQMLIGDVSDNVRGVDKIGPVKAGKLLDLVNDEFDMYNIVFGLYNDAVRLTKNANLLWIRRKEDELWEPPISSKAAPIELGQEARSLSTQT